jgi:hypothetical protein
MNGIGLWPVSKRGPIGPRRQSAQLFHDGTKVAEPLADLG